MPFRKDHLQLVTDAGATLDIGWDYGTPYSLDPINGVDVNLQKAQGVNQIGETVERQSVAGVSRELIIHCHSPHGDADAALLLEKLEGIAQQRQKEQQLSRQSMEMSLMSRRNFLHRLLEQIVKGFFQCFISVHT